MLAFVKKISTIKLCMQDEEIMDLFFFRCPRGGSLDPPEPPLATGQEPRGGRSGRILYVHMAYL